MTKEVYSITPEQMVHDDAVEFAKTSDNHREFLEKEASKVFKVYLCSNDKAFYDMYNMLTQERWRERC